MSTPRLDAMDPDTRRELLAYCGEETGSYRDARPGDVVGKGDRVQNRLRPPDLAPPRMLEEAMGERNVANLLGFLAPFFRPVKGDRVENLGADGYAVDCACGRRPVIAVGEVRQCRGARFLPGGDGSRAAGCELVYLGTRSSVLGHRPAS